jgi:hypothetical protein
MNAYIYQLFIGPDAPFLPLAVYLVLAGTAVWDAWRGIVPNIPLALAALAITIGRYLADGWQDAATFLALGAGAWLFIWVFNELWFRIFKKDAIGMGDAKWTAVAVAAFGVMPALFAWFAGAWVAIIWIIGSYLIGRRIRKVFFAPFLMVGLTLGLLVTRGIITLPYPLTLGG